LMIRCFLHIPPRVGHTFTSDRHEGLKLGLLPLCNRVSVSKDGLARTVARNGRALANFSIGQHVACSGLDHHIPSIT
jgi:hypothetical protein